MPSLPATKSAAWSFTKALRVELLEKGTQVLGLHVGFMDTDMTKGFEMQKVSPEDVSAHRNFEAESGFRPTLVKERPR